MQPIVFGTAGHIDHGKTTLTRALTGQETDRLPEEKARGISIDLGFAHFSLPSGRPAALIDVPGHERFVRNMVAGVHGMDAVLLVVAADEGVMPQTREHLDILTLLGVQLGLTVVTKADLVEPEWLELVMQTTREVLATTFLEDAPMLAVDAVSGRGIEALWNALDHLASRVHPRPTAGFPRLPVDRVFTVKGFGTVATGTLISGGLHVEQAVELAPEGFGARIRTIEVHNHKVTEATAGQRVAVNLAGIERAEVHRGQVISLPGMVRGVETLVAELSVLPVASELKINERIHCHVGTAEAIGRLYFYDRNQAEAGSHVVAEIRLESPLAVVRGDRVLIRSYSPVTTVAGGVVLEIGRRHRRREQGLVEHFEQLAQGGDRQLLMTLIDRSPRPLAIGDIGAESGLAESVIRDLLATLTDPDHWLTDHQGWWWAAQTWRAWADRVLSRVHRYHREHPLRVGIGREQLRTEFAGDWPLKAYNWALERMVELVPDREWIRAYTFEPGPVGDDVPLWNQVLSVYSQAALHPPTVEAAAHDLGISSARLLEFIQFGALQNQLVRLEEGIYIHIEAYHRGLQVVSDALSQGEPRSTAQLREVLGTNRKFTVSFLELLDSQHVTRRVGDARVLDRP